MPALAEIEAQAMELTASQRAKLAASLLDSLPALLYDDDEGLAEAHRRDAEMDNDPSIGLTTEQLRASLNPLANGYHLSGQPLARNQANTR
jgi:putative addiction module component (TIGR02574 family)